jgi:hypothetical protein
MKRVILPVDPVLDAQKVAKSTKRVRAVVDAIVSIVL